MRFSLSLPILADPRAGGDPFRPTFELARLAEEAGFDTATVGHHHFMAGSPSDPLTFMTAVAARTSSLRVGTGVFQLPVHNPVRVAEQVATLDQISGGRVSLGVGTGWWDLEYQVHGSNLRERGGRMTEALEVLRLVWTTEDAEFHGRYYDFPPITVHPRPVQKPHPPIWVAGVADPAVERAARLGDAWIWGPVQSLSAGRSCLATYRRACARAGRSDDWILRRFAWIGRSSEQVRREVLPVYVDGLLRHWSESAEGEEERELLARLARGERVPPEEVARDRLLWGDADEVIAQIERYRQETGCDHLHAAFGAGMPSHTAPGTIGEVDQVRTMIELFGERVIPAFRP